MPGQTVTRIPAGCEKFFVPTIGMRFQLVKDWTFKLYDEDRNRTLIRKIGLEKAPDIGSGGWDYQDRTMDALAECTMPKGLVLTVDRIYIRKGAAAFDSLTFCISKKNQTFSKEKMKEYGNLCGSRFWAKLGDVNEICCKVIED